MLSDLTLVMPTRDRPAMVQRSLGYYAAQELASPVIVADGSSRPAASRRIATVCADQEDDLSVSHLAAPAETFVERVLAAVKEARTEFVAIIGDDDFFVPAGLTAALAVLRESATTAVAGRALSFVVSRTTPPALSYRAYPQQAFLGPTPVRRLRGFLSQATTFYAVRRREQTEAIFDKLASLQFDDLRDRTFLEHFDTSLLLLGGEVAYVDRLLLVREGRAPGGARTSQPSFSYFDMIAHPHWHQRVDELRGLLAEQIPEHEAERYVRTLLGHHAARGLGGEFGIAMETPRRDPVVLTANDLVELTPITRAVTRSAGKVSG